MATSVLHSKGLQNEKFLIVVFSFSNEHYHLLHLSAIYIYITSAWVCIPTAD